MAGVMVPTNKLRWNSNESVPSKPYRLEQLWKEVPGCAGDQVRDPKREWRPVEFIAEGWDVDNYWRPLEEQ